MSGTLRRPGHRSRSSSSGCCLLRTLMSYNGKSIREGGAILQPDLAADDPEISADGLTWTFRLKDGLHYAPPMADKAIVSGDIVRALERALRHDPFAPAGETQTFGPYAAYFSDVIAGAEDFTKGTVDSISGLEAPDDATLVVHLLRPAGIWGLDSRCPLRRPCHQERRTATMRAMGRTSWRAGRT